MKTNEKQLNQETYKVIGACMNVHNEIGSGLLEAIYQEALEEEFNLSNINYLKEEILKVYYKGKLLNKRYQVDFLCFDEIIIELKAVSALNVSHQSQLINYLNISKKQVGLLINFGAQKLEFQRLVNTQKRHKPV
jgi:GxxExxY protein